MNAEKLRAICKKLPHVTEDIKWGHDLCFCIAEKMFLVMGVDGVPVSASFKVKDEEFEELCNPASPVGRRKAFKPAPYVARYKWVLVEDIKTLSEKEWKQRAETAYELIKAKLPKAVLKKLD
jgi:predicted DNA-binding protein (MmcQ/YjbR family)